MNPESEVLDCTRIVALKLETYLHPDNVMQDSNKRADKTRMTNFLI